MPSRLGNDGDTAHIHACPDHRVASCEIMHTIAVSGSQLDVADSAIGPKNQQLSVDVTAGRREMFTTLDKEVAPGPLDISKTLEVLKM